MATARHTVTRVPVRVSYDADADRLHVCEFGTVAEERMADQCPALTDQLRLFLRHRGGPVIGFEITDLAALDADTTELDLWGEPRFTAPTLGVRDASVAEIALRARTTFGGRSSTDVAAEERGHAAGDPVATELAYREALEAGALRAHLGLASALSARGRYAGAYEHARIFTELAPRNSWGWAWLGRACVELGALEEARRALRRAIRLERAGSYSTPARELLRSL
jgi:tetratricopeptide (TPR) repeat protein